MSAATADATAGAATGRVRVAAERPISETTARRRARPRRRRNDRLTPRDAIYVLALLLIAGSLILGVRSDHRSEAANRHAAQAISRVQEGRATAITITCAVLSSISEAGRAAITGTGHPPPPAQERALEALGFPPFKVRHARQAQEGGLYVQAISRRVNRELLQLGEQPVKGLVRKDGTIDCRLLQEVSAVPNPR